VRTNTKHAADFGIALLAILSQCNCDLSVSEVVQEIGKFVEAIMH